MRELTSYKATTVNETGNDTGNTKIDKLEKSNTGIAIDVLLNSKKGYTQLLDPGLTELVASKSTYQ